MLVLLLGGCASYQESPKYQFSEGIYRQRFSDSLTSRVYVDFNEEQLLLFPLQSVSDTWQPDTSRVVALDLPKERQQALPATLSFSKPSFDLDVLTMPFKFRPSAGGLPAQLNTNFQGALYLGMRRDVFKINYKPTPLQNYRKHFNHFGYSLGLFTGLGSSVVNETVTNNQVSYEYDGVLFSNGIGAVLGVNNLSIGLAVGADFLMDSNRSSWVYQRKPWVGLAFGLNLN
ncbi:hypothetical protein FVR03_03015 [Pontibacter qinzhouensis]|uniref:Uncharacterized protein n=1 Tax=Pontibacter qinzhouensis TaxID=2603253 RepID=A0A5C8KAI4_9BACT|nr:hypothetical protein [Pontibacter qinzhouensis]TXK51920.1 hypothetical protein FVR03_03015 [Pontibacter qinzhouensis]